MLTARSQEGWREPRLTVWGTTQDLSAVPSLLCEPGSRLLAQLEGNGRPLWVDVIEVGTDEPLDDIGQPVLRATVVADDRINVAISKACRAQISQSFAELLGRLRTDPPEGDHVHLEWYHPIDDPLVTDENSPYITWAFGIPSRAGSG